MASAPELPERPKLITPRLRLWALLAHDIQALIDGAPGPIESEIGASFPDPFVPPPLMEDALEFLRDQARLEPANPLTLPWFFASTDLHAVVGAGGFFSTDGGVTLQLGYAIYPAYERQGYATEATRALLGLAWSTSLVKTIQATIPPWNTPSIRVAEKLGMQIVGTGNDSEVGEIGIYEITREQAS